MYQGHHRDGSGIQKHSAGSHYPYVVFYQEGKAEPWRVMNPAGEIVAADVEAWRAFSTAEMFAACRKGA